ncbi:tudor domain-containing protein 7 [Hemicordylus capensis]|uniref:tudor domain-containing protein 7 n=1 Tax=Hemicordylus capensis TaxID=884348 RepID=UPI0023044934|nr:tudor domain-containing protein 7 [Hemicordylus capensis]XP_053152821.1 tudor domain-containing protein 7 [Hemicordylus capensis]XP_053152822.1 tudor domain-containing protein 7 [Hemicordylus capensis]XP_053152823.1 tudor domain-containing protein 7 [Hemicordylus capensis]
MNMQEADLAAKMLRAVLQSHKTGVPFSRLQGEYKSLTGDWIPFKQLGHPTLEDYVKSVPGVVRVEISKSGEVICHAVTCQETARIAQLVARQRTSKRKVSRAVNCRMRLKKTPSFASVGKPKDTLRKPGFLNFPEENRRPSFTPLKSKGSSTVVRPNMNTAPYPLSPVIGNAVPKEALIQEHMTATSRPEKRAPLPPRFQKDLQVHLSRNLSGDLNENVRDMRQVVMQPTPACPSNIQINEIQKRIKDILNRFNTGIWLSKIPHLYREAYEEDLNSTLLPQLEHWPHICVAEKMQSGGIRDVLIYPATKTNHSIKGVSSQEGKPRSPLIKGTVETQAPALHGDLKQQIATILLKYSSGLWANALPKVYEDTYKAVFPHEVLNKLDLLSDICTVDYISGNPKKAILYAKSTDENQNVPGKIHIHEETSRDLKRPKEQQPTVMLQESQEEFTENIAVPPLIIPVPGKIHIHEETSRDLKRPKEQQPTVMLQESQEEFTENIAVPPLIIPAETSPSVLVVELNTTNEVVVRYVGKDYSAAQELMEDEMKDCYCRNPLALQIQSPKVGQLVAVPAEEEAWLRAEIVSTEGNRIKVCYVDHGFSEIIENSKVYKLAKQFYSLPFQASKCRLAGLETFCDDPVLVKMVESQTCGKIFAVEILEKSEIPLVVLYDTSGEDDININAVCLKALSDKSLELHLQVGALYTNVVVTNVCSDGTLYCQVPSRGLTKLLEALQKLENYFYHKPATEYAVSLPYCGMICLLNCKGKWARVEITSVHSTRALDVQFMDTGTVASVKVAELREIPSVFLREIIAIPPQATKCCLADLPLQIGMWTPDAVLWLRDTVLNCFDCSIKVVKLDDSKRIAHIYLFTPKNFPDPDRSINRQITNADLWKHQKDVFLSAFSSGFLHGKGDMDFSEQASPGVKKSLVDPCALEPSSVETPLTLPPPLPLAKPGEQMDVFVSLACHPGYFVLQPWQEMHSLEVLLEEMLLHYSTVDERDVSVGKNKLYVAKVGKKWHRVLLKGILANGLVSVYELDYGKHELVSIQNVRSLLDKFRKLPFQAITAQLAGVEGQQWSEEASIVFRNHVEKKPLVAQVEAVNDGANPWDRKVVTYLVDTSQPDTDIWIHDIMTQYLVETSKAN